MLGGRRGMRDEASERYDIGYIIMTIKSPAQSVVKNMYEFLLSDYLWPCGHWTLTLVIFSEPTEC